MSRQSVSAGICARDGDCAMEKGLCETDDSFLSSRQIQTTSRAHGGHCLERASTEAVPIGKCGGADGELCTSVPEGCSSPGLFASHNKVCNIVANEVTGERSLFGSCDGNCVWSQGDCTSAETWKPASEAECTCDEVLVGACEFEGIYSCAVSSDSCDSFQTWVSVNDLKTASGAPDCRLCRPPPEGGVDGDLDPLIPPEYGIGGGSNDDSNGAVLGALIGGGMALLLLFFVATLHRRSAKQLPPIDGGTSKTPPLDQFEMDTKKGSDIDNDDVSEMGDHIPL